MKPFLELAQRGGLLFDGAIGSLLYERGVYLTHSFDHASVTQPELVRAVHESYLQAGSQVLTTNTFGANRFKLRKHDLDRQTVEINESAVLLAREVAGGRAYVAGSVGPSGLTFDALAGPDGKRAEQALEEQIRLLADAGVDVLCLETFGVLAELENATRMARDYAPGLPVVASYTFQPTGLGRGGQTPAQVARRLVEAGADVVGANCGGGPDLIFRVATPMVGCGKPVLAQANAGRPETVDGRTIYVANPEYFGVFARRLLKAGVKVLGGCCGTSPDHIRRMSNAARMMAAEAVEWDLG